MNRVLEVRPGEGLTLHLRYADGATLHVDVAGLLMGAPGVFAPLRTRAFFEEVRVGRRGRTITWPGELDLDVDALRLPPERSGHWFRVLSRTPPRSGDSAPAGDPATPGPLEG